MTNVFFVRTIQNKLELIQSGLYSISKNKFIGKVVPIKFHHFYWSAKRGKFQQFILLFKKKKPNKQ